MFYFTKSVNVLLRNIILGNRTLCFQLCWRSILKQFESSRSFSQLFVVTFSRQLFERLVCNIRGEIGRNHITTFLLLLSLWPVPNHFLFVLPFKLLLLNCNISTMIPLFILNLWQRSLAFFQGLNDSVKNSCFFCLFDIANFSYFFLLQKIEKDVGDVQVVDNRHVKIILLSSIFLGKYLKIELGISFGLTPAFDCFGGVQQVKGNNVELKIICKKPHSQGYFLNFKKKKKKKNTQKKQVSKKVCIRIQKHSLKSQPAN
eukprot:TRINITY_DN9835_c0_g1_i4.p1 TRINITY_DN9835_c0_g1~~TRINITY_DN9835_c0_g1_i4.p1  ORF type:complete len:259 (+),score=-4.81 TRINITY_DN9835_c0_g1_i4:642-1418(+)